MSLFSHQEIKSTLAPAARDYTSYVINLYEDTVRRMSYTTLSIATITGARRPSPKPFNISNFDQSYPSPPTSMPDENSSTRATVGVAAQATSNYIKFMKYDNDDFGKYWEEIRKQIRGGCVCPSADDFTALSNLFADFNKTMALYYNVNSTA